MSFFACLIDYERRCSISAKRIDYQDINVSFKVANDLVFVAPQANIETNFESNLTIILKLFEMIVTSFTQAYLKLYITLDLSIYPSIHGF
jgi:hypothetical protein